jgi:hypothetical protein
MSIVVHDANLSFRRPLAKRGRTTTIVIHHAASVDKAGRSQDVSVETIHQWHLDRDGKTWAGIGYHYVIRTNGDVWHGRPEACQGAHCKPEGMNRVGIGICLAGCFTDAPPPAPQVAAMWALIDDIHTRYPGIPVKGHRDFEVGNECPGSALYKLLSVKRPDERMLVEVVGLDGDHREVEYVLINDQAWVSVRAFCKALSDRIDVDGKTQYPRIIVTVRGTTTTGG